MSSRIQTAGPNNGHQLRDYSKSSNGSENRPNRPLIYLADGRGVLIYLTQLLNALYRIVRYMRPLGTADYCHNADRQV